MFNHLQKITLHYAAPVIFVLLATWLRISIEYAMGGRLPTFITFFPAVMIAAVLGGIGPGIATTVLSMLAAWRWVQPTAPSGVDNVALALFGAMGIFMSIVAELSKRYQAKAQVYESKHAEQKIYEKELVRVSDDWQRTFDSVPDMIAIIDDKNRIIRANRAMAKALGRTPEKCEGLICYECIHGTSYPPDFCPHTQTIKDGKEHMTEIHEDRLGGDYLLSTTPIFDKEGRMVGTVHVARDITAHKKAEEELRNISRIHKALGDNGYAMMNAKDEEEYLNEACKIIINDTGHSMAWIGYAENNETQSVRPVAYAGFEEGYTDKLNITWSETERGMGPTGTAIRTAKPVICKNMATDPNFAPWREEAMKRGYAASVVLPLVSDGRVLGAVNIYSKEQDPFSQDEVRLLAKLADDIAYGIVAVRLRATSKKAEEVLKRDNETLERMVLEKSEELINAQSDLNRARRLSDIGTLAATVAHELRNPLAAINMAAYNIKRKAGSPLLERHLANIEKKVTESNQIINNLLFYSRLKPPQYERVNINKVINECVDAVRDQFETKAATVNTKLDATKGAFIEADPLQLKEVFSNLLENAYDSLPESGGGVDVVTAYNGEDIEARIRDNGAGVDKEHLLRIFDPFFTTKAKGTGLGLSVCSQIVKMHNGNISIESEPGKGATVSIVIPKERKR